MLPLLIIFSYLMGSIPSGYILVKKKLNKDVREYGSGNIGATNVRRVAGEKLSKITVTAECVTSGAEPKLEYDPQKKPVTLKLGGTPRKAQAKRRSSAS